MKRPQKASAQPPPRTQTLTPPHPYTHTHPHTHIIGQLRYELFACHTTPTIWSLSTFYSCIRAARFTPPDKGVAGGPLGIHVTCLPGGRFSERGVIWLRRALIRETTLRCCLGFGLTMSTKNVSWISCFCVSYVSRKRYLPFFIQYKD